MTHILPILGGAALAAFGLWAGHKVMGPHTGANMKEELFLQRLAGRDRQAWRLWKRLRLRARWDRRAAAFIARVRQIRRAELAAEAGV